MIVTAVCIALGVLGPGPSNRPLVGAIRWDGWYGTEKGVVCKVLTECLSPKRYQHRAPFWAKSLGDDAITIGPYTPKIMDREIAEAKRAGIDYWAFVTYDEADPLSDALKLYLASRRNRDVRFCVILEAGRSGDAAAFPQRIQRFVDLMRKPTYVRVLGDRPLFYLGFVDQKYIDAWGGLANARKLFDGFRESARAAGAGDPYIAVMDFSATRGRDLAEALGADAVSCYAIPGDGGNNSPYSALTRAARTFWDAARDAGAHVIPTAMTGWDRRPRIERPHPWEPWQKAGEGMNRYFEAPTPQELADHVAETADWTMAHPDACPAGAMLVYAWNEHDEGGWLCPTLGEERARILALERMWRDRAKRLTRERR